ncbi:hypothetical protein V8E54_007017 [Elaphomyces granulatus]
MCNHVARLTGSLLLQRFLDLVAELLDIRGIAPGTHGARVGTLLSQRFLDLVAELLDIRGIAPGTHGARVGTLLSQRFLDLVAELLDIRGIAPGTHGARVGTLLSQRFLDLVAELLDIRGTRVGNAVRGECRVRYGEVKNTKKPLPSKFAASTQDHLTRDAWFVPGFARRAGWHRTIGVSSGRPIRFAFVRILVYWLSQVSSARDVFGGYPRRSSWSIYDKGWSFSNNSSPTCN